jgi:hypothetical protein
MARCMLASDQQESIDKPILLFFIMIQVLSCNALDKHAWDELSCFQSPQMLVCFLSVCKVWSVFKLIELLPILGTSEQSNHIKNILLQCPAAFGCEKSVVPCMVGCCV